MLREAMAETEEMAVLHPRPVAVVAVVRAGQVEQAGLLLSCMAIRHGQAQRLSLVDHLVRLDLVVQEERAQLQGPLVLLATLEDLELALLSPSLNKCATLTP